jgi:hypothetical protein
LIQQLIVYELRKDADCSSFCFGRITPENNKKTFEEITKVFEDMGVPKDAVHIVIYEALKTIGQQAKSYIQKKMLKHPTEVF